jgi:glycosyltransferase involved in cell wall biosynthesis
VKVVHLASSGELGGAELVILDVLAGLREARPPWELMLIVPAPGPLRDRAIALGIPVVVLDWGRGIERLGDALAGRWDVVRVVLRMSLAVPAAFAYIARMMRALRAAQPSVLHAHGFKMHIVAMLARSPQVPLVLHLHDYIGRRPLVSRLLRVRRRGPIVGAAISRSIADDASRVLGRSIPVTVVYNGIDTARWTPRGPSLDLDRLASLPPAAPGVVRVGLIATMARWKGHDVFLQAMALLQSRPTIRGYVIGGSIYRTDDSQQSVPRLREMAERLGVSNAVGFTGYVDDPVAAMRALDIVVHASTLPEPFGRVIVEAMATERAMISTATGGASELFEPERSGVAVPPGDGGALAAAIERLAGDPAKRRALGHAGRLRVVQSFDRATMTDSIVSLYDSVGASGRGSS